jgi:2-keto-3-deoxy-L-rhamnonate aldolase RhmA
MFNNYEFGNFMRKSENLIAPLISIEDPSVSELLSHLNPDFLVVDMEHSAIDISTLQKIEMASKPLKIIARIRGAEKNEIKKVLDTGVAGIIVPGIESVKDVKNVISYSKLAPEGVRGAGPGRASNYGHNFAEYVKTANEALIIIQIETKKAYENINAILSVPDLDGFFIGPVDLSIALPLKFSWDNEKFTATVDHILEAAKDKKLIKGIYSPLSKLDFNSIIKRHFNFLILGTDREAIAIKYIEVINKIKNTF